MCPDELDVNFAWKWLKLTSKIDDDPFVDVRTGYITGKNPEQVLDFVKRIKDAVKGKITLPAAFIDNLGPNNMAEKNTFFKTKELL